MRLAVLILGFAVTIAAAAQTLVALGISAFDDTFTNAAWFGVGTVLAIFVGTAFVHGLPWVGFGAYLVGAGLGAAGGKTTQFTDLFVWGGLSLLLAGLAIVAVNEKAKHDYRHQERNELLMSILLELRSFQASMRETMVGWGPGTSTAVALAPESAAGSGERHWAPQHVEQLAHTRVDAMVGSNGQPASPRDPFSTWTEVTRPEQTTNGTPKR
jgi:hypothetical protein